MDMIVNSQFIIEQRKSRAWSQQHLADVSGLSLRTVQRIENTGSGAPDSIKAVAMAFGLVPADLMQSDVTEFAPLERNKGVNSPRLSKTFLSAAAGILIVCLLGTFIWLTFGSHSDSMATESSDEKVEPLVLSTEQESVKDAVLSWLVHVDSGDYLSAWQSSDPMVKGQVSSEQWQQAVKPVRETFGDVLGRTISTLKLTPDMQGLPDGEYAMVVFETRFKHKSESFETIPMSKSSGQWRPIGYFIR